MMQIYIMFKQLFFFSRFLHVKKKNNNNNYKSQVKSYGEENLIRSLVTANNTYLYIALALRNTFVYYVLKFI